MKKYTLENIGEVKFNHQETIQIRFNDIDVLGHVNNAVQLSYCDLGKVKYFEAVKKHVIKWNEAEMVVVNLDVDFYSPIFFGDDIRIATKIYEVGNKSMKLVQVLFDDKTKKVKSICHSVMCGFDVKTNTSVLISDEWRDLIFSFETDLSN